MGYWLICYDICNLRRLRKMHKALCAHAIPVQWSAFILTGSEKAYEDCLQKIRPIIDPKEDDLRGYPLTDHSMVLQIGKGLMPEGVYWFATPLLETRSLTTISSSKNIHNCGK